MKIKGLRRFFSIVSVVVLMTTSFKSPADAQPLEEGVVPYLPPLGVMVQLSPGFTPAHLLGIIIHPDNALQFDFLIHPGDQALIGDQKKEEYKKLVKYFLASLTIPDEDQWVNLSPYEHQRIIKDDFGKTEMGRDLLAEDYMLKQITSSMIYPEEGLGKKFWDKIYERAWKEYHTSDIPVNTFNKVWIVPDQAVVYESGNSAYILKSHLKVMLEEDYLSLSKHQSPPATHTLGSQVIRELILPELERDVNEGENFANLRQMYSGMILAIWYKNALKESFLGKIYADKAKIQGIDQDPKTNQVIYQRYLKAFKKGVFNYIKEDVDKYTHEAITRKYFSGGFEPLIRVVRNFAMLGQADELVVDGKDVNLLPERILSGIAIPSQLVDKLDIADVAFNAAMMVRPRFNIETALEASQVSRDKAMEAGVKIDTPNSSLWGVRDRPVHSEPLGVYYQICLYHYPTTGNYTVGIIFNPKPSEADSELRNEVEITLGTTEVAVAERIFDDIRFSAVVNLAISYFLDPVDPSVVDSICRKVKEFSDRARGIETETLMRSASGNAAMAVHADDAMTKNGGIDFNAANLAMVIKRDGSGVALPIAQQDMAQLSRIQGFDPEILKIRPAVNIPIINELKQMLQITST